VSNTAKKSYKTCITDLTKKPKQQQRTERAKLDHVSLLQQAFVGGVVSRSSYACFVENLYTFSCNIFYMCYKLDSNLANLEATDGIISGVSFS